MWRLRDAPPNIGNRFPEITTQNFYSIKNVATGQYLATPSGGTITASSSGTSVSNTGFSQAIYTHILNAEPVVYSVSPWHWRSLVQSNLQFPLHRNFGLQPIGGPQ